MSETNVTEIKSLNGYPLADTKAREDIAEFSKEIEGLEKAIEDFGESRTIEKTGAVVMFDGDASMDVNITGDATGSVSLIHQGKNFIPSLTGEAITKNGITITPLGDGSYHFKGTSTEQTFFNIATKDNPIILPQGDYVFSSNCEQDPSAHFSIEGVQSAFLDKPTQLTVADTTEYPAVYWYFNANVTLDGIYWAQLEIGSTPTTVEQYNYAEHGVSFPAKITAYDGTNVFYTKNGDVITTRASKSLAIIAAEVVDEKLKNFAPGFDAAAYGMPILELTGDVSAMTKDNAVDLAYVYTDADKEINLSGTASVKWQGSSSVRYPKKNYTIKFDQAFEVVEGWGAQKKYCFKANYIDPSHARNIVAARLWGQVIASRSAADEHLAACPNYGAVDGIPCIITLNGEFHGLYTWNIPKDGWMLNFPTSGATKECILCAEGKDASGGEAFKKTESALDVGFSVEYITDENDTGWALTSLNNLITACISSDGSDLDTTLAAMIDWDSVVDYFCFSAPFGNYDGLIKNYLLYTRDGVKWRVGAYDLDCLWGNWWDGSKFLGITAAGATPAAIMSSNKLFDLAGKYKADKIKARYKALRNSVLSEDNVATEIANFIGGIPEAVFAEEHKTWPTLKLTSVNGYAQITDWYRRRVAMIDAQIEAL